jgi:hypothetical protein
VWAPAVALEASDREVDRFALVEEAGIGRADPAQACVAGRVEGGAEGLEVARREIDVVVGDPFSPCRRVDSGRRPMARSRSESAIGRA